jgi:hypothetical protein
MDASLLQVLTVVPGRVKREVGNDEGRIANGRHAEWQGGRRTVIQRDQSNFVVC